MKRVPFAEIDGSPYAAWWNERFAPQADIFADKRFYQRGRANIWVGTADITGLSDARVDAVGIHLLRIGRRMWKPTSGAIVAFGDQARANVLELNRDEVAVFLAGGDIGLPSDDPRCGKITRGFVTARYRGAALGCAEWHERGVVVSLIPKNQRVSDIDL
jgi:NOL1/NOP2/fmu family ribosome biogenesis protein